MFKSYQNYLFNIISASLNILSQILLLIYLNRHLGLEYSGFFSLSISILGPLFMFFNMQLKWLIATDNSEDYNFEEYLILRLITSLTTVLIALVIFLMTNHSHYLFIFCTISAFRFFDSLSEIAYGHFQKNEKFKIISFFNFFKSIGVFFVLIFDYYINISQYIFLFISLIYATSFFAELIVCNKGSVLKINSINFTAIYSRLKFNWKYGVVSFFVSLKTNISRYFLSYIGLEELAVFTTMNYLNYGSNFIFSSLGEVNNVDLAKSKKTPFESIRKFVLISLLYSIIFLIIFFIIKKKITFLLFGGKVFVDTAFAFSVFLSGFAGICVIIVQNYYMLYRQIDRLLFLNVSEILIISISLYVYYITAVMEMDIILFIQFVISSLFAFYSFKVLHKIIHNVH